MQRPLLLLALSFIFAYLLSGCTRPTPNPGLTLTVSPTSLAVFQQSSATVQLTLTPSGGASGGFSLYLLDPKTEKLAGGTLSPDWVEIVDAKPVTITLTLFVPASTPAGTHNLKLRAAGGVTAETPLTLTVNPPFTVAALDPADLTAYQSSKAATALTLTPSKGFSGTVELNLIPAQGGPLYSDITLFPNKMAVTSTSPVQQTLTIRVGSDVSPGTRRLLLRAVSGGYVGLTNLNLNIKPVTGETVWPRQFGTPNFDTAASVEADGSGGVYVAGDTAGSLFGTNASSGNFPSTNDAFLAKYDPDGSLVWGRQFGTTAYEYALAVAVDATGGAYVAGSTQGDLYGPSAGSDDAFIARYDRNGNLLWGRQWGTANIEQVNAVATDSSCNVYLAGTTYGSLFSPTSGSADAFVAKYDAGGNLVWGRQFGTSGYDDAVSAAVGAGGRVYIVGSAGGALFDPNKLDVFLAAYDSNGVLAWGRQFGTQGGDRAHSVAASSDGSVYVVGETGGALFLNVNMGLTDAFIAKYDDSGILTWGKQLGSLGSDVAYGAAADADGNLVVAGDFAAAALPLPYNDPKGACLAKFDPYGAMLWGKRLEARCTRTVATDSGGIYTAGNVPGASNMDSYDAFLARLYP